MKRFQGGLVFKAHRLVYHSSLGWRVIKKKEEEHFISNLLVQINFIIEIIWWTGIPPGSVNFICARRSAASRPPTGCRSLYLCSLSLSLSFFLSVLSLSLLLAFSGGGCILSLSSLSLLLAVVLSLSFLSFSLPRFCSLSLSSLAFLLAFVLSLSFFPLSISCSLSFSLSPCLSLARFRWRVTRVYRVAAFFHSWSTRHNTRPHNHTTTISHHTTTTPHHHVSHSRSEEA